MSIMSDIWAGVKTTLIGMRVTVPYIWRKPVTLHYPHVRKQLPERSRNRLYVNMDDCIGCDQCARACPVNCITIETAKAVGADTPGVTSDGRKKALWVTRFDIDIAKCCYCGLCTFPCPTECIKMTDVFEFSEVERSNLLYSYVTLTPDEIVEKSRKAQEAEKEMAAKKAAAAPKPAPAKPAAAPAAAPAPVAANGDADKAAKLAALQAKMAAAKAQREGGAAAPAADAAPSAAPASADDDKAAKLAALQAKMAAAKARAQGGEAPEVNHQPASASSTPTPAPVAAGDDEKAKRIAEMQAKIAAAKAKKEQGN